MNKPLTPLASAVLLIFLGASMMIGVVWLKLDIHILMICALVIFFIIGIYRGHSFKELQRSMFESIGRALPALMLFFLIGMMVGIWAQSGTLPTLVHYGLSLLSVDFFLPASLLLCAVMTLATGSAWGTVATVGVALIGVGNGLGISLEMSAGAIIAGASFGDKMSPVSDTTNLSALAAGTDLYEHIRGMLPYSIFSFFLCGLILFFVSPARVEGGADAKIINLMLNGLNENYTIAWWQLTPAVVVMIGSLRKIPAEVGMLGGIAVACAISYFVQGVELVDIFKTLGQGHIDYSALPQLNKLLSRGGLQSMMWTISLAMLALSLGGVLEKIGLIESLFLKIRSYLKNKARLVSSTIVSAFFANLLLAEAYLSILICGKIYRDSYNQLEIESRVLSRSLEQGATLTTALIPWTTAGAFYTGILGIGPEEYAFYASYNWLEPLIAVIFLWFWPVLKRAKR